MQERGREAHPGHQRAQLRAALHQVGPPPQAGPRRRHAGARSKGFWERIFVLCVCGVCVYVMCV